LRLRPLPASTLFLYTTLFRSRELNASTQMLSKDRGAYGRVRLALLLALPGTAFNDDTRAAGLLDSLAGAGASEPPGPMQQFAGLDRKSTRLNSSHVSISYAVF